MSPRKITFLDDREVIDAFNAIRHAGLSVARALNAAEPGQARIMLRNGLVTEFDYGLSQTLDLRWPGPETPEETLSRLKHARDHGHTCPICKECPDQQDDQVGTIQGGA